MGQNPTHAMLHFCLFLCLSPTLTHLECSNPMFLILSFTLSYLSTSQKCYAYLSIHTRTNKDKDDLLGVLRGLLILWSRIHLCPRDLQPLLKTSTSWDKLLAVIGASLWLASLGLAFNPNDHQLAIRYGSYQTQTLDWASQPR